ncbi:MAG: hypothetical protein ACOCWI_02665 [Bacillota bacterium]
MTRKSAKKNLIYSFLLLIGAAVVSVSAVFGWFVGEQATTDDFFVYVSDSSTEVGLDINNQYYGGGELVLEDAYPTSEYLFSVSVIPAYDGNIRLFFTGIDSEFYDEDFDMNADMADVMAIKYPVESATHTTINDLDDGLIVDNITAYAGVEVEIEFLLFFNDQPPLGHDINLYQCKVFEIQRLVIEVY